MSATDLLDNVGVVVSGRGRTVVAAQSGVDAGPNVGGLARQGAALIPRRTERLLIARSDLQSDGVRSWAFALYVTETLAGRGLIPHAA